MQLQEASQLVVQLPNKSHIYRAHPCGFISHPLNFEYFKNEQSGFMSQLVARGLNLPLKHAGARNKRGGVSARGSEARASLACRRLDCPRRRGLRVLLLSLGFVSWRSKKGRPRGGYRSKNQRAEGTKKIFLTLLSANAR